VALPITSQYFEAYRLLRKGLEMLYGLKVRILSASIAGIPIKQSAITKSKITTTEYLGKTV